MFGNIFRVEGFLYKISYRLWNLLVLNGLIILTSLPVITIGASLTAAYSVTTKMIIEDDSRVIQNYKRSFKENFMKSTIMWVLLLLMGGILFVDLFYLISNHQLMSLVALGVVSLTVMTIQYVQHAFFYVSRYEGSLFAMAKNTIKIILHQPVKSLCLLMLSVGPYLFMALSPFVFVFTLYISLFIGISFQLFLKSYLLLMIYNRYEAH